MSFSSQTGPKGDLNTGSTLLRVGPSPVSTALGMRPPREWVERVRNMCIGHRPRLSQGNRSFRFEAIEWNGVDNTNLRSVDVLEVNKDVKGSPQSLHNCLFRTHSTRSMVRRRMTTTGPRRRKPLPTTTLEPTDGSEHFHVTSKETLVRGGRGSIETTMLVMTVVTTLTIRSGEPDGPDPSPDTVTSYLSKKDPTKGHSRISSRRTRDYYTTATSTRSCR